MKLKLGCLNAIIIHTIMKPLKHLLISLVVISFMPIIAKADDGNTIFYYSKTTMTPTKISLDDLDKMTFSYDGILMWKQSGMDEIMFEDFLLFTFTEIEHPYITDVESLSLPFDLRIRYVDSQGTLFIDCSQPLNGVSVYDLQGRIVKNEVKDDTNYRIKLLTSHSGVYLVKVLYKGKVFVKKIVL